MEASNDVRVPDANGGVLREILGRWSASMATLVLNEVECRLRLMHELRGKLDIVGVDEVHDLQPVFERGLWMFGPQFESAEFTANLGMTKVIQKLFKNQLGAGSRSRPDFVVLPESSIGLYASPSYDDVHEVDGIDHLAVIELKTTGRTITGKDREQVWEYVRELEERGYLKPHTRVDGYVLGDCIARGENRVTVYSDTVRIRPMLYETILERAEKRLLNLHDRIKGVPFLKGDEKQSEPVQLKASAA